MPSFEYYADLERRCLGLEARLKSELGPAAYRAVDKNSGFISAGEYGLYVECVAENLFEERYRPSEASIVLIEELLEIMGLDLEQAHRLRNDPDSP